MNIRIDLLRDSDRRYQGPVSKLFIMITSAVTVVIALVAMDMYYMFDVSLLERNIQTAQGVADEIQPRYKELGELQASSVKQSKVIDELEGWKNNRIAWHPILVEIRTLTPDTIQLIRVENRDLLLEEKIKKDGVNVKVPYQEFKLHVSGKAYGDDGESTVVNFVQAFSDSDVLRTSIKAATLQSVRRDQKDDTVSRLFDIDASGFKRILE